MATAINTGSKEESMETKLVVVAHRLVNTKSEILITEDLVWLLSYTVWEKQIATLLRDMLFCIRTVVCPITK
jgi:hypothetical protein